MPLPLLIMLTGDVPDAIIGETGNFDRMFLRMADYAGLETVVRDVARGETPDDPEAYCGTIVTGSPAMVTDREPWSVKSGEWLRRAVTGGRMVLGVCYGHQLLAQAMGGVADYHPKGMELGTRTIRLLPGASEHPLLSGLPPVFRGNFARSQTVVTVPPGATALAANDHDPHQIIAYGPNAIGTQFHPEFDRAVTQSYIDLIAGTESMAERVRRKRITLGSPAEETPEAASLLQRFVAVCRAVNT